MKSVGLVSLCGMLWLLFVGARTATIDYTTIDDSICRFSFPTGYQSNGQDNVSMYSIDTDNITFDVHRFLTGNVANAVTQTNGAPAQPFQQRAANRSFQEENNVFVQMLQQATGGQIINQTAVTTNGKQGTEVEINYAEPGSDQTSKMFVRFYWIGNVMYAFSVVSETGNSGALAGAKTTLFNSIYFY